MVNCLISGASIIGDLDDGHCRAAEAGERPFLVLLRWLNRYFAV